VLRAHNTAEFCITSPDATPFGKVDTCPLADEAANVEINIHDKHKIAGLFFEYLTIFQNLQNLLQ
jgi:hypothetical protein